MSEDDIPQEARAFLAGHIESVLQLEILLLLRADPARSWTAPQLANEFRIDAVWASVQLANFAATGVFKTADPAGPSYRYAPDSPALEAAIAAVAEAYTTHRVTLIALIFSKPPSPLRSFADAFRLRKDKPDG